MERKVESRSFRDGAVKKLYSPKILSSKKSSASTGIWSGIPRSSHPVQGHAGTQRGRLKELRIRCVARKFLYLWIRKTFGRVFPSKARCYYKQRVLRKVFEEWKAEWWVSQREWKLCVRADCYYRYYLYSLMFQTWQTYVHQQQGLRAKYTRAENYGEKRKCTSKGNAEIGFSFSFMETLFFGSSFRFTAKLRGRYSDYPTTFCPYTYSEFSPFVNIFSHGGLDFSFP
uniref:SFI1 centrin binding protein n=1 Tax=Pipistrellus kuhlii TaxID=59472 RepID=A0A7J7UHG3_PIPKU|nr:SFI1 centrin binding protein [Pipistrellus kuhlii]